MRPKPIEPGAGQESVWDYPRPPRLESVPERIRILFGGEVLVDTTAAFRVLETSHPPTYYLPPGDIAEGALVPAGGGSTCEWKGPAVYYDVVLGGSRAPRAAWAYLAPWAALRALGPPRGVLCCPDGGVFHRRGAGRTATRRLLRWLGHRKGRRAVQGWTRLLGLVEAVGSEAS